MSPSGFRIGPGSGKGKVSGLIGAVIFAVAGTVMFWRFSSDAMRWEIPCTFVESRIVEQEPYVEGDIFYVLQVRYTYTVDGETSTSDVVRERYSGSRDRAKTEALANQYAEGSKGVCYVSWFDASDATLEKPDPFTWTFVVFPFLPLVLILLGLVGGALWRGIRGRKEEAGESPATGPMTKKSADGGPGCLIAFFALFFTMGSVFLFIFFIRPVYRTATSDDWVEVQCIIISSGVGSHSDSDGTTYSIDIKFRYEYEGKTYQSDDYNFMGGSSSGRAGKEKVVKRYPAGSEQICFVNPKNPSEAVLSRDLSWEFLFGLIPLLFVIVGLGGIYFVIRRHRKHKADLATLTRTIEARPGALLGRELANLMEQSGVSPKAEWLPEKARGLIEERGPIQLKPVASPWGKVIVVLIIALFWNGMVTFLITKLIREWAGGGEQWFFAVFFVPFVLVGIGLIFGVIHAILATFNPRPVISVSSRLVPPGEAFEVAWLITGNIHRLRSLRIYLEGREEAKYQRGTKTYTARNTFTEIDIVSSNDTATIPRGEMAVVIPDNTMHSFESPHNKIIWTLKVHGGIHRWPDVKSDYEIVILPQVSRTEALQP